jgi:hypothetical protein
MVVEKRKDLDSASGEIVVRWLKRRKRNKAMLVSIRRSQKQNRWQR